MMNIHNNKSRIDYIIKIYIKKLRSKLAIKYSDIENSKKVTGYH